jgi:hypothetical protein
MGCIRTLTLANTVAIQCSDVEYYLNDNPILNIETFGHCMPKSLEFTGAKRTIF